MSNAEEEITNDIIKDTNTTTTTSASNTNIKEDDQEEETIENKLSHKRKIVNDQDDDDEPKIPNKILLANNTGDDNTNTNQKDPDKSVENEMAIEKIVDRPDEDIETSANKLDESKTKEILESTTKELKKNICLKKLTQLNDLRHKCIDNLNEQYYLENDYNYIHYDKWKLDQQGVQPLSKQNSDNANKIKEDVEILNIEKKIVDQFSLNKPVLEKSPNLLLAVMQSKKSSLNSNIPNDKQSIAERAKHEAQILQRISQLRKDGLWSIKRLPKLVEPPHPKTHWDYLLDEMTWMSTDFQQERRWKKNCSRKLSQAILKYFKDKELKTEMAEKEETKRLRKQASMVAREIMIFWKNVEKIAQYKQKSIMEEKRKQAMDVHLNFIVDQTEKYSSWLMESLNPVTSAAATTMSSKSSTTSSSRLKELYDNDDEFNVDEEDLEEHEDDESTIEKEENLENNENVDDEIKKLQMECELPLDDLLKDYNLDENYFSSYYNNTNKESGKGASSVKTRSDRLLKRQQNKENVKSENDNEMDVDNATASNDKDVSDKEDDNITEDESENDEENEDNESDEKEEQENSDEEFEGSNNSDEEDDEETIEQEEKIIDHEYINPEDELAALKADSETPLEQLLTSSDQPVVTKKEENKDAANHQNDDKMLNSIAATAQSLQPTGYTLETTNVKTPVPSLLLKHTLREYQHVGLDWLVTMYENKLNGILADEMGLGKTIQTIALLAHLACEKGIWGPHLIVVPTSVMLNWELEFKKWCPGFKILTYYGNPKERRLKRQGWTKVNAFHVCITSYKLVIQDHAAFRRKKWKYFILDEAQNIKNFKSQRWQALLNFQSQRRLLLTGTPLQNNLMELWSLMHFLMPHVFSSHREFQHWFSNPLKLMIEGNQEYNEQLIKRLHKVLRPFILRRLKSDVEKQMPKKYEHVIRCKLSKRQRLLYEEFMSLSSTRDTLAEGRYMSVINILMQLRKVCNHPDLFDPRPIVSSFVSDPIHYHVPSIVFNLNDESILEKLNNIFFYQQSLADQEFLYSAFGCHRAKKLQTQRKLIEEIMINQPQLPPTQSSFKQSSTYNLLYNQSLNNNNSNDDNDANKTDDSYNFDKFFYDSKLEGIDLNESSNKLREKILSPKSQSEFSTNQRIKNSIQYLVKTNRQRCNFFRPVYGLDLQECVGRQKIIIEPLKNDSISYSTCQQTVDYEFHKHKMDLYWSQTQALSDLLNLTYNELFNQNKNHDMKEILNRFVVYVPHVSLCTKNTQDPYAFSTIKLHVAHPQPSFYQRQKNLIEDITNLYRKSSVSKVAELSSKIDLAMKHNFPEKRLIQYDCGKLQTLSILLRQLFSETHRVLIFTQMTRMLDILENFLNYHGYKYLRLDGSTSIEQRQALMERFNNDKRIFCFILSTRSGGIGVNLTGADTVIFYDSDWNPTMDAQAQDRCHRIGQTRDVNIYRLISEKTVEENILKKANQKRLLSEMTIEGGCFTTAVLKKHHITELFDEPSLIDEKKDDQEVVDNTVQVVQVEQLSANTSSAVNPAVEADFEAALEMVEDESDVKAAKELRAEVKADIAEFDENDLNNAEQMDEDKKTDELSSRLESEFKSIENELRPIEKYALKFLESHGNIAVTTQEQDMEINKVKQEWELNRLKQLKEQEELKAEQDEDDMMFTYKKTEVSNTSNNNNKKNKKKKGKFGVKNKNKKKNKNNNTSNNNNNNNVTPPAQLTRLSIITTRRSALMNSTNNNNNKNDKKMTTSSITPPLNKSKSASLIDDELNKLKKFESSSKTVEQLTNEQGKSTINSLNTLKSNKDNKRAGKHKKSPSISPKLRSPSPISAVVDAVIANVIDDNENVDDEKTLFIKDMLKFNSLSKIRALSNVKATTCTSSIKVVNDTIGDFDSFEMIDDYNNDVTGKVVEQEGVVDDKVSPTTDVNKIRKQRKPKKCEEGDIKQEKTPNKRGRKPKTTNQVQQNVQNINNFDTKLGDNLLDKLNSQIKTQLESQQHKVIKTEPATITVLSPPKITPIQRTATPTIRTIIRPPMAQSHPATIVNLNVPKSGATIQNIIQNNPPPIKQIIPLKNNQLPILTTLPINRPVISNPTTTTTLNIINNIPRPTINLKTTTTTCTNQQPKFILRTINTTAPTQTNIRTNSPQTIFIVNPTNNNNNTNTNIQTQIQPTTLTRTSSTATINAILKQQQQQQQQQHIPVITTVINNNIYTNNTNNFIINTTANTHQQQQQQPK